MSNLKKNSLEKLQNSIKMKDQKLTVEEIVEKVKQGTKPLFRPNTESIVNFPSGLLKCLHRCWNEKPELRPTMKVVSRLLKKLQAGL